MSKKPDGAAVGSTELFDDMNILLGVLTDAPELNPGNYDHEDVCRLNTAMIEAWSICKGVVDRLSSNASAHPRRSETTNQNEIGVG